MIIGDPYYFAISFDVAYRNETNPNMNLGIFNFIMEDIFFPAKGGNYTLKMVTNHLIGCLDKIKFINEIPLLSINDPVFFTELAHSLKYILISDSDDFHFSVKEPLGVDLTPLEFADFGYYIFYVKTKKNEVVFYTTDYGESFSLKELSHGYVYTVIDMLRSNIN
jgi:hypothetical protein